MGYTILGTPIRLIVANVNTIGEPEVEVELYEPFECDWYHDACAPASRRFVINEKQVEPWYRVVTCDDTFRDILCKMAYAGKVELAKRACWDADYELRKLTH